MAEQTNIFQKKTFVAVTGASRGLGKSIALQFGAKFPPSSVVVVMARNLVDLENVRSVMASSCPKVTVLVRQYDQGHVENKEYFSNIFDELLQENKLSAADFDQFIVVHNCANEGDTTKRALELSDAHQVRQKFDINLTGMILLNTSFFKTFNDSTKSRIIVNMTSAAVMSPLPSVHMYSAGKVARDMFFRVLSVEEPSIRVLTYAPGCVDTDMHKRFVDKSYAQDTVVKQIRQYRLDGKVVSSDTSIARLVQILEENTFVNAAYVDFDEDLIQFLQSQSNE